MCVTVGVWIDFFCLRLSSNRGSVVRVCKVPTLLLHAASAKMQIEITGAGLNLINWVCLSNVKRAFDLEQKQTNLIYTVKRYISNKTTMYMITKKKDNYNIN